VYLRHVSVQVYYLQGAQNAKFESIACDKQLFARFFSLYYLYRLQLPLTLNGHQRRNCYTLKKLEITAYQRQMGLKLVFRSS